MMGIPDADARRKRGRLKIKSDTVGAQVFINGKPVGAIPLKRSLRLRKGRHTVRLSKLGYADFLESVTIKRGRTTRLEADLIELDGILNVDSFPAGADVIVDGRFFGRTPIRDVLETGQHTVVMKAPQYLEFRTEIDVEAGQEIMLNPDLIPAPAPPPPQSEAWYQNRWIWVGTAGVVLTTALALAIATSNQESGGQQYPSIVIETMR